MSHPLTQEPDFRGEPISLQERRYRRVSALVLGVVLVYFPAILFFRANIIEPFRIPSGAMEPTLLIGDHIFAQKYAYGWRYPFTRVPISAVRLPQRGDIVVFVYPGSDEGKTMTWLDVSSPPFATLDYVKRVVGLPGDTIELRANVLYLNGEPQRQSAVGAYDFVDDRCHTHATQHYIEDLDGRQHSILRATVENAQVSNFQPTTVPEGHLFVMGDNRDHSADSRLWGFVPVENLKGKAVRLWVSMDDCGDDVVRTQRFWNRIQ